MSASQKKPPQKRAFSYSLPSNTWSVLLILGACFIMGGGVYDLINRPDFVTGNPYTGQATFIALLTDQTLTESLMSMILILVGFSGLYLVYKASESGFERGKMNTRLGIGAAVLIVTLTLLYFFSLAKVP